ncbi:hypothetical protein MHH81_10575 [Psychrobacillus sp. FSL H8-0484]|uniref:hypothetical protein n=1 Tax=Psychrobacillus sp. FSL H8-0484 TaxID=2921390 RepID=UPI0030F6FE9B
MRVEVVKRILIGIIATVIFSFSLAVFTVVPFLNGESNTFGFSLPAYFIIFCIFSGPVFIIAGFICSFIIDTLCTKYLHALIGYIIAGKITAIVILYFNLGGPLPLNADTFSFLVLGILASLLYYHIFIIWRTRFFKRSLSLH